MKIVGLDGREYDWKPVGGVVRGEGRKCSKYHRVARELLRTYFPQDRILEEVFLPGLKTTGFADFYLPLRMMILEVQGEQHYKFTPIFHGNRLAYMMALKRDIEKKRWCVSNGITFVELPYNEDINGWSARILAAHSTKEDV